LRIARSPAERTADSRRCTRLSLTGTDPVPVKGRNHALLILSPPNKSTGNSSRFANA